MKKKWMSVLIAGTAAAMIGGCGQNANTAGTTQAAAETTSAQENGASQETGAAGDEQPQADVSSGEETTGPTVEAGPDIAVADTQSGKVQGYISNGIYTYHGISYAQADERFVEAHEVEPWEGVRMAFDYGPISPQEATGNIPGGDNMDNNCQNLNI